MTYEKSAALRAACDERGIGYSRGYNLAGRRVDEDRVTTLWDGEDADSALTFEEDEHGSLWCADEMGVEQAIGAYLAGR